MADKIVNTKVKKLTNVVDQLFQQIEQIQKVCKHTFSLKENLTVTPSLIDGISLNQEFTVVCIHCSLEEDVTSKEICPRCLGKMAASTDPNDDWWRNGRQCEAYYGGSGRDHSYYAPRIRICNQCGWKVVWKEWEQ